MKCTPSGRGFSNSPDQIAPAILTERKKSATAAAQFFCLSNITLSPSITLSANYPSVPITHSARVFARALYLYQCNRHLSISRLQGNSNYLCTCVLHTIIAAPLINATLLNPHRLTDRAGKTLLNCHTHKHKQTTVKVNQTVDIFLSLVQTASEDPLILLRFWDIDITLELKLIWSLSKVECVCLFGGTVLAIARVDLTHHRVKG